MTGVPKHLLADADGARAPLLARRNPLSTEQAARRTTAYVTGNVLVLAALIASGPDNLRNSTALMLVLGTAVSTFVAHVYAEMMGTQVRTVEPVTWSSAIALCRDSFPILSSGLVPSVVIVLGGLGFLPPDIALGVASSVVVLRIAGTGIVVARLRNKRSSRQLLLIGVAAAATSGVISFLKAYLTH